MITTNQSSQPSPRRPDHPTMPPRARAGASRSPMPPSPMPPRRVTRRAVAEVDAQHQSYIQAAAAMTTQSVLVQSTMSPGRGQVQSSPASGPTQTTLLPAEPLDNIGSIEEDTDEFDLDLFVAVLNQETRQKAVQRRRSSHTPSGAQRIRLSGAQIEPAPGHDPEEDSLPAPTSSQFMDGGRQSQDSGPDSGPDSLPSAHDAQFESVEEGEENDELDDDSLPDLDDTQFAQTVQRPRTRSRTSAEPMPHRRTRRQAALAASPQPPLRVPAAKRRRLRKAASVESDSLPAVDDSQFRPAPPRRQRQRANPPPDVEDDSLPQPTDSQFQPYSEVESNDELPDAEDAQFDLAAATPRRAESVNDSAYPDPAPASPQPLGLLERSEEELSAVDDTQSQEATPRQSAVRESLHRQPEPRGTAGTGGGTPRSVRSSAAREGEVEIVRVVKGDPPVQRIAPPSPRVLKRPSHAYDATAFASPDPGDLTPTEARAARRSVDAIAQAPSPTATLRGPRRPRTSRAERASVGAAPEHPHSPAHLKRKEDNATLVAGADDYQGHALSIVDENRSYAPLDDGPMFDFDPYDYEAQLEHSQEVHAALDPASAPLQRPTQPSARGFNKDGPDLFMVDEDGSPLRTNWDYKVPADYEPPPTRLFGRIKGHVSQYSRLNGRARRWTAEETLLLWRTVQKVPVTVSNPMDVVAYLYGEYGQRSTELAFYNKQHMRQRMVTVCETRTRRNQPIIGRARMFLPLTDPRRKEYDDEFNQERAKADELIDLVKHEDMNDESEFDDDRSYRDRSVVAKRRPPPKAQRKRKREVYVEIDHGRGSKREDYEEEYYRRDAADFAHVPPFTLDAEPSSDSTSPSSTPSTSPSQSRSASPEPRVVGGHALRRRAASAPRPAAAVSSRADRALRRKTVQVYTSKRPSTQLARPAASTDAETPSDSSDDESAAESARPERTAPRRVTRASAQPTEPQRPPPRPARNQKAVRGRPAARGGATPRAGAVPKAEAESREEAAAASAASAAEDDHGDGESDGEDRHNDVEGEGDGADDRSGDSDVESAGTERPPVVPEPSATGRSAADDEEASQAVRRAVIRQKVLRGGL